MWILFRYNVGPGRRYDLRVEYQRDQYLQMKLDRTLMHNEVITIITNAIEAQVVEKPEGETIQFLEAVAEDSSMEQAILEEINTIKAVELEKTSPCLDAAGESNEEGKMKQKCSAGIDVADNSPAADISETSFKWDDNSIKLLLTRRFEMEAEFNKPKNKKYKLWQKISDHMKDYGYHVLWSACDSKYRNLAQTYRKIRDRLRKTGEGEKSDDTSDEENIDTRNSSWDYFDLFHANVGKKANVSLKPQTLGSTFNNEKRAEGGKIPPANQEQQPSTSTSSPVDPVPKAPKGPNFLKSQNKRVRDPESFTVKQYLYKKCQTEEKLKETRALNETRRLENEQRRLANEARKLELEQQRLECERERNEALRNIANAISKVHRENEEGDC